MSALRAARRGLLRRCALNLSEARALSYVSETLYMVIDSGACAKSVLPRRRAEAEDSVSRAWKYLDRAAALAEQAKAVGEAMRVLRMLEWEGEVFDRARKPNCLLPREPSHVRPDTRRVPRLSLLGKPQAGRPTRNYLLENRSPYFGSRTKAYGVLLFPQVHVGARRPHSSPSANGMVVASGRPHREHG